MAKRKKAVEVDESKPTEPCRLATEVERLNQRIDNMMERVVWLEDNFMASRATVPSDEGRRWNIIRLFQVRK